MIGRILSFSPNWFFQTTIFGMRRGKKTNVFSSICTKQQHDNQQDTTGKKTPAKKPPSSCGAKFSISDPMEQELQRVLKDPGNRYLTPKQVYESNKIFSSSGLTPAKFWSACYRIRIKLGQLIDEGDEEAGNYWSFVTLHLLTKKKAYSCL